MTNTKNFWTIDKNMKKPAWAVKQLVRETGIVENVCCHGVGHPTDESAKKVALRHKEWEQGYCTKQEAISAWRVHGCDGCCSENTRKKARGVSMNKIKTKKKTKRFHIVVEGTDERQMYGLFEDIQNYYSLYDNCVIQEVTDKDSIIDDDDRCSETGEIICKRPNQSPKEPKE